MGQADIVYVHDPDDAEADARRGACPVLLHLPATGEVSAIGIGMNQAHMLARFVADPRLDLDVVLLAGHYTLLDHSGLDLLDLGHKRGAALSDQSGAGS